MVNLRLIGFLVHLVFGLYFLDVGLGFITLPEFVTNLNDWWVIIGGLLIITGGFGYLKKGRRARSQ